MPLRSRWHTVDTDGAEQLLEESALNRITGESTVIQLRGAMTRHLPDGTPEWKENGESLIFAGPGTGKFPSGPLLDGKHRLTALAGAAKGTKIRFLMVDGVDPESFDTIDTGKSRSLGDILHIMGYERASALAAAVRWLYFWRKHGLPQKRQPYPTMQQLLRLIALEEGLAEAVRRADPAARKIGLHQSIGGAVFHVLLKIDQSDADFFITQLDIGAGMATDDPIHVLREMLLTDRMKTGKQVKMTTTYKAAIVIKAWNHYRGGSHIRHLQWRQGGARPEPFPIPDGIEDIRKVIADVD